jgi:predicted anti-sigma-YlaC factor YlaD
MRKFFAIIVVVIILFSMVSCISIEDIAMDSAADILTGGSDGMNIFTTDDDPQLIADALPLALKLYEMILGSRPERADLQYETGKNFVMYANAFIQTPAGMLPDEDYLEQEKMLERAKKMYLRGRDYLMKGIELTYPGFNAALDEGRLDDALKMTDSVEDAEVLYWTASGWIGAYSCEPFDFELASSLYIPAALLLRALEIDGNFNKGAIHDILIQIYSSLPSSHILNAVAKAPETVGKFHNEYYTANKVGNLPEERALFHFNEAIRLSSGLNPGTYNSYASTISVKKQDYIEYKKLLETALSISPSDVPENELVITIYQEKARWMLENAENFFILDIEDY